MQVRMQKLGRFSMLLIQIWAFKFALYQIGADLMGGGGFLKPRGHKGLSIPTWIIKICFYLTEEMAILSIKTTKKYLASPSLTLHSYRDEQKKSSRAARSF